MSDFIKKIRENPIVLPPGFVDKNSCNFLTSTPIRNIDNTARTCERGRPVLIQGQSLNAVIWAMSGISFYHTPISLDFISFDFSGCVMATFDLNNQHYGAHIQRGLDDCAQAWIDFVNNTQGITNLVMFRPDAERMDQVGQKLDRDHGAWLWGVITPDRRCYSICVTSAFNDLRNFKLMFIEQHLAPFHIGAYQSILDPALKNIDVAWKGFWKGMTVRDVTENRGVDIGARTPGIRRGMCCR